MPDPSNAFSSASEGTERQHHFTMTEIAKEQINPAPWHNTPKENVSLFHFKKETVMMLTVPTKDYS